MYMYLFYIYTCTCTTWKLISVLTIKLKLLRKYWSCWWNEVRPWNGVVVGPVKTSLSPCTVLQSIPFDWRTAYVCDSRVCATKLTRSWTSSRTPCVADLVRPRDSLVFRIHRAAYDCMSVTVGVCTSSLANTDLASSSIPWSTSSAPRLPSFLLCVKRWFWYVRKFLKVLRQPLNEHSMQKSGSHECTSLMWLKSSVSEGDENSPEQKEHGKLAISHFTRRQCAVQSYL